MANKSLQCVDFIRADGKLTTGLVPVHKCGKTGTTLSIDEQAAIIDAKSFNRIDFVYFRRFSDGRSSQVAAYVLDNSDERLDQDALGELHLQVWLQGTAALLYIGWPSRVDVLTCARGPDFWNKQTQSSRYKPAEKLDILRTAGGISSEMRRFSALRLADGTFWEDPQSAKLLKHDKAAHQSLIQAVVEADKELDGKNNPVLRRLLLLMVLIKYLEDREVFPNSAWFGRFHKGARSFFDVLKGGTREELDRLLKFLEDRFNGDIFNLSRLPQQKLTRKDLKTFADLVEARTLRRQRYLWGQFSFKHLPVEIISHLYQRFVEDGHGAVYTPAFLASLLLDHAMPYDKLTGDERVLDPACGSGVFLVGAFRRLINVWRRRHKWKPLQVRKLKEILARSIHGIDLDSNAIDLASFSLSLAICDALKPDVIWNELTFDPLRESNLFEADFFRLFLDKREGRPVILDEPLDIVIGNPPFESKLTQAGKEIDEAAQQQDSRRGKCPDNQAAYLFLEQALSALRPNSGRVCLIQPAGFLYNRNVNTFRTNIFQKCQVHTILDFTSIRKLYEADPKTVAVLAYAAKPSDDHKTVHSTFRRTASVKERICFELDHYDRHRISQQQAESDPYVWRANLLGGGRLLGISQRLRSMRTLVQYIEQNGWEYGEGFVVGDTVERKPAPFLYRKPCLPANAFTDSGIDERKIEIVTETNFRSPYTQERYSVPLLLIKEVQSLPLAFWTRGFLAYGQRIVGIHAPSSQASELHRLYEVLRRNHDTYRFCCTLFGTQSLLGKATAIPKQDIDALPYPENPREISLSFWEKALCDDALSGMAEYVRLGQKSDLLRRQASKIELDAYAGMFCQMLGSVYDNLQAGNSIYLNGLICQPFYFGDTPRLSWLNEDVEGELRELIYYKNHEHLRTIRVFRLYSENVMLIVKPDRLRYWIRSTAIRDADETLIDLRKQGY